MGPAWERTIRGDDAYGEDDADRNHSPDDKPGSWSVRSYPFSGHLRHKHQSESSAEEARHCEIGGEYKGIGPNYFNRGPGYQEKKEERDGEGNQCDTEIKRESFHEVEIDRSLP